jgi:hypothetical protein
MFVLGTQYYRYPTPVEHDWRADLEQIRRLGMTAVKIWMNWAHVQPTPEAFAFDAFDRLMDESHQAGLQVVIQAHMHPPRWWSRGKTVAGEPEPPGVPANANPHGAAALGMYRACRLANVPVAINAWDDAWQPGSLLYFPLPWRGQRSPTATSQRRSRCTAAAG